jgi:glutaredoxin
LLTSTGMALFSLILIGLLVIKIHAFCFFCVLSASLSLALFVLSLLGGDWQDQGQVVFRVVLVGLVVGLVGLGWAAAVDRPALETARGAPPAVIASSTPEAIALAEHLSGSGAAMYSAYWCPHCHEQKELFGKEATAKLKVIECAPDGLNSQKALCDSKKIEGFPTWEINGKLDVGVKPLAKLAQLSGFRG